MKHSREKVSQFMTTLTLEEAQATLADLIHSLTPGTEVVITENNQPVAKLVAAPVERPHPLPGRGQGMLVVLTEDDEHLEDFKEYMP
jgi:antitoxin (DNA-binding transcriptional repressor) of toxin-antitoxin stability system